MSEVISSVLVVFGLIALFCLVDLIFFTEEMPENGNNQNGWNE